MPGHGPVEDYIDVQCSDTFRGFYYERGLTPHPPSSMDTANLLKGLISEIRALKDKIIELTLERPDAAVRPSQSDSRPFSGSPRPPQTPKREIQP